MDPSARPEDTIDPSLLGRRGFFCVQWRSAASFHSGWTWQDLEGKSSCCEGASRLGLVCPTLPSACVFVC